MHIALGPTEGTGPPLYLNLAPEPKSVKSRTRSSSTDSAASARYKYWPVVTRSI